MSSQEVLNCSFPEWYMSFKAVTEESIVLPIPQEVLDYLHEDGVVLPQSSTHGVYTKSSNLAMDGDEEDLDIRDDELMNMYEADWSMPSQEAKESQPPNLEEFDAKMKSVISSLGGRVFPKMNWSAPRDAAWISFDKTLMCTCPSDVYLLLKSSQFIAHDLDHPFSHCKDKQPVSYCLVLRRWCPPSPAAEFRCFVRKQKLICVCQRNVEKLYPSIAQEKSSIVDDVSIFFNQNICGKFSNESYVFDVIREEKGVVQLVDFNPWNRVTDGLMFEWDELEDSSRWDNEEIPEFRYVVKEDGVKSSTYSQYAVPLDIVDLPSGQNPFTLMEAMRLEAERQGNVSSSSDDEEENKSGNTER